MILSAAELLRDEQIESTAALVELDSDARHALKARWRSLPGQRSGISWRYFQMLAGVPGVKPDRMIHRFLVREAGLSRMSDEEAADTVAMAAAELGVDDSTLDHAIWNWTSGRRRP